MTNGNGGRPLGSQTDETAMIMAVEAMLAADATLSDRAAIIAVMGEDDSDVRRIQRKLKGWREGDPCVLLAGGVEHGEPRRGLGRNKWVAMVDIPTPGYGEGWGVAHAVHFATGPHLIVVRDEELAARSDHPDLPVFRAVDKLPRDYSWDHKGYRAICSKLGFDPDRDRPPELASMADKAFDIKAWDDPATRDREMARVQVAFGFERNAHGYQPSRLASLYRDACEGRTEDPEKVKADVLSCLARVDWDKQDSYACLHELANPFGFEHQGSIWLHGSRYDGLDECARIDTPLVIAPPDEGDVLGRLAARLHERHCNAIVLSAGEREAYRADEAHWLESYDWHKREFTTVRSDLAMSYAIVEAMQRTAYQAYADKVAGIPFDPLGPLSHETRAPIVASATGPKPGPLGRAVSGWRDRGGLRRLARGAPPDGIVRLPWGEVIMARDGNGHVSFRPSRRPLSMDGTFVAPSVSFHAVARGMRTATFDVTGDDFAMVDEVTGQAVDPNTAMTLLRCLRNVAVRVMAAVPARGRAETPSFVVLVRA